MTAWQGKITDISFRDWNEVKLWTFQIEGETRKFRTGTEKIEYGEGDEITFEERNSQVVSGSVKLAETSSQGSTSKTESAAPVRTVQTESASEVPVGSAVGRRIRWQEARRDATTVIVAALKVEALPWSKNVAKGKKLDLLRGYIHELTAQFIEEEDNV